MNGSKAYIQYTEQNIYTASPGEILLMLYNAELKNIKTAILFIEKKRYGEAHEKLLKAQDIITELISSLDFSYKISHDLLKLYDYISIIFTCSSDYMRCSYCVAVIWSATRFNYKSIYGNRRMDFIAKNSASTARI